MSKICSLLGCKTKLLLGLRYLHFEHWKDLGEACICCLCHCYHQEHQRHLCHLCPTYRCPSNVLRLPVIGLLLVISPLVHSPTTSPAHSRSLVSSSSPILVLITKLYITLCNVCHYKSDSCQSYPNTCG